MSVKFQANPLNWMVSVVICSPVLNIAILDIMKMFICSPSTVVPAYTVVHVCKYHPVGYPQGALYRQVNFTNRCRHHTVC